MWGGGGEISGDHVGACTTRRGTQTGRDPGGNGNRSPAMIRFMSLGTGCVPGPPNTECEHSTEGENAAQSVGMVVGVNTVWSVCERNAKCSQTFVFCESKYGRSNVLERLA